MRFSPVLILALGFSVLCAAHADDDPVNFAKVQQKDFVRGGGTETITLKITAKSFNSPFVWSVSVTNKTGTLFFVSRDDAWLDRFFGDDGYVQACKGYVDCKKKWYFHDLVDSVLTAASSVSPSSNPTASWEQNSMTSLSEAYLLKKGVAASRIKPIQIEMKKNLSSGYSRFIIPLTPVQDDASYMYVKSLNYFVPYLND